MKMTKNDIKKALYKENPTATRFRELKGVSHYATMLNNGTRVDFQVPESDMGTASFERLMEAKLLIRWMVDKR